MRHHFLIDQRILENINESAKKADLSTETVLIYAFYEVINSWTDWSDNQPRVICFTGKCSFTVQRQSTNVTALDTCRTFEQLIAEANKPRIDSGEEKPIFVLNYESKDRQQAVIENSQLTCSMTRQGDDLEVLWDINASFKHYKSDRELVAAHQKLLTWLATGFLEQRPPSLLPSEQQKVREEINGVSKAFPDHLLHKGFFEKASETPDQIALIWSSNKGTQQVTYHELAKHALSLASVLVEAGVKPNDFVAVTLPKGMNQ
ncbi:MAG: AMP-binding protein, partial [Bacteroidota bacterium]